MDVPTLQAEGCTLRRHGRHGYVVERIEELGDRSVTHMVKRLTSATIS